VPIGAPDGPNVTIAGASDIELTDPFIDDNTVDIATGGGNATLSSSGDTNVTLQNSEIEGPWTNLTELDVVGVELEVDPDDKPEFNVTGGADSLNVSKGVAVADGSPDFVIDGTGTAGVTIQTGTPNERIFAVDQSNVALDDAISDGSGEVEFTGMSLSKHVVSLRLGTGAKLTNLRPQGLQQSAPSQIKVQVNSTDFPGQSARINFTLDGSQIASQLVNSNGTQTASIPASGLTAGSHSIKVNATNQGAVGQSTVVTGTYELPDTIYIRNETSPNTNVTANVEIISFGANDITRNFSASGAIDLTGLPTDEPLLIRLENDSFHPRTTLLDNLYTFDRVYMLNKTFAKNNVRFVIDDRTGQFSPDSSQILINRALRVNGTNQSERISGDFGAVDGHTAQLINGKRHRIIVRNDEGDTRILGGYDVETDETVELEIGEVIIEPSGGSSYVSNASFANATNTVRFEFNDESDQTDRIQVKIFERGNASNVVYNQISNGPFGGLTVTQSVPGDVDAWVVEYSIERNGTVASGSYVVGPQANLGTSLSPHWQSFIGVVGLVVIAGLFGGIRAELGAIAVPLVAGGLYFVGWLPAAVGAGAVLLALVIGVLYYSASSRGAPAR
jgi:hypothetical protein